MIKALFIGFCLVASVLLAQSISSGHGGQWVPPGDIVPPNLGGPGDITPGTGIMGPSTPGPSVPGGGPVNPAGFGAATGGATGKGARTGGLGRKAFRGGEGYERWEFWWENNKDPFLNLKGRLGMLGTFSGTSGFLTGRGQKNSAQISRRPTLEIIKTEVLPYLMQALKEENADILDSTVLALARSTRAEDGKQVLNEILPMLKSSHPSVQQSATLSLGVLGSAPAIPFLHDLMIDSKKGRDLVGRHEVPQMVRAFAALSLGLINSSECVERLMQVVKREPDKNKDLKVCAITALGLLNDGEKREEIVSFLSAVLSNRKMDPFIKAAVPTALGKLGDSTALTPLIKAFKSKNSNNWVKQSCVIALGQLAGIQDKAVIELLKKCIADDKNDQTRHFAYIALGQIGARGGEDEESMETHEKLANFFLREIRNPRRPSHIPWAALGGALHAREHEPFQPNVIDKASEVFRNTKNPSHRSAMAIVLGLLNARRQGEMLFDAFRRSKDNIMRGYIAVSLGLIRYGVSAEALHKLVAADHTPYRLRLDAALGLGLMGDTEAVHLLVETVKKSRTLCVTSAAVKALGLIGDRNAIAPLRELLQDKKQAPLSRAFAAVALGIISEKTDLPWNSEVSQNFNYRAKVPSIAEVLDIL